MEVDWSPVDECKEGGDGALLRAGEHGDGDPADFYCSTPVLDLLRRPLLFVEEMIVQLLQPAGEDGVSGLLLGSETVLLLSCCADRC